MSSYVNPGRTVDLRSVNPERLMTVGECQEVAAALRAGAHAACRRGGEGAGERRRLDRARQPHGSSGAAKVSEPRRRPARRPHERRGAVHGGRT